MKSPNTSLARALAVFGLLLLPAQLFAAGLEFRPYCGELQQSITEPDAFYVNYDHENCTQYTALDPATLITEAVEVGSIIDIDLVVTNPDAKNVKRFSGRLEFDPTVLDITDLTIDQSFFDTTAPGGADINEDGNITIDISKESDTTAGLIRIGTITATVLQAKESIISLNDMETYIYDSVETDAKTILDTAIPILQINVQTTAEANSSVANTNASESESTSNFVEDTNLANADVTNTINEGPDAADTTVMEQKSLGASCSSNAECISSTCVDKICRAASNNVPLGGECVVDFQCGSANCQSGTCQEALDNTVEPVVATAEQVPEATTIEQNTTTAFPLLQIRNLQVTTEGTNVYIAWDPLGSSQLKAYNVYYSTVSEQYIQRKTIPSTENSLTLRNMELGVTQYFAVRGVNMENQETAFSTEVSIVTGNPDSSSSPLIGSILTSNGTEVIHKVLPSGEITVVPGETGLPSVITLAFIISAVLGTLYIVRRSSIRTIKQTV